MAHVTVRLSIERDLEVFRRFLTFMLLFNGYNRDLRVLHCCLWVYISLFAPTSPKIMFKSVISVELKLAKICQSSCFVLLLYAKILKSSMSGHIRKSANYELIALINVLV